MGYRLLPSDVCSCPRLLQLNEAKVKLDYSHSVIIEGAPGSGKSISAYQLAWDYLQMGWEVLKLNIIMFNTKKSKLELNNYGYRTVLLIDDAQQIDGDKIIELMAKAGRNSKLIITQTITLKFTTESVTISQKQAVEALYDYYYNHKDEILPIINR